jgi:hypothetical protein
MGDKITAKERKAMDERTRLRKARMPKVKEFKPSPDAPFDYTLSRVYVGPDGFIKRVKGV